MKLQFNLTKEQGEAYTQFKNAVNINNLSEEEFAKTAFMIGLQQMERAIIAKMQEEMEQQAQSEEGSVPEIVEDEPVAEEAQDETEETKD